MAKDWYEVLVTRDTTEHTHLRVEADSPAEAEVDAIRRIRTDQVPTKWEPDDAGGNPYIADPGNCARKLTPKEVAGRLAWDVWVDDFLEMIAGMRRDGEDLEGEAFEMAADDAVETVNDLISRARRLTGTKP